MAVLIMDITGYRDIWSPCYERNYARCYILLTLSHKDYPWGHTVSQNPPVSASAVSADDSELAYPCNVP